MTAEDALILALDAILDTLDRLANAAETIIAVLPANGDAE